MKICISSIAAAEDISPFLQLVTHHNLIFIARRIYKWLISKDYLSQETSRRRISASWLQYKDKLNLFYGLILNGK